MRNIFALLLGNYLLLASCGNRNHNNEPNSDSTKSVDSIPTVTETTGDSILNGREIAYYLTLPSVPEQIKTLHRSRNQVASVPEIGLVMDSIFSKDTTTQPFYFLVASELMQNTDGAPSETAGISAKRYVETNSAQFVHLLANEPLLGDTCLNAWVKSVSGEIKISAEKRETDEIAAVASKMVLGCVNCSEAEQQKLNLFIERLNEACSK